MLFSEPFLNAGMPDCSAFDQPGTEITSTGMLRYRTEMSDVIFAKFILDTPPRSAVSQLNPVVISKDDFTLDISSSKRMG